VGFRSRELRRRISRSISLCWVYPPIKEVLVLSKLLATSVALMSIAFPSAAMAGALDGETLTGSTSGGCSDFEGQSFLFVASRGTAVGPVVGTYTTTRKTGEVRGLWDTATGSVISAWFRVAITPAADPDGAPIVVNVLEGATGVGSCTDGGASYSLTVTDMTYTTDSGDTGIVSLSLTQVFGVGTFTAVFGPQLPTTKAQCEKNGWKTYPAFKNQGDCVSYVATKGKNKPARS